MQIVLKVLLTVLLLLLLVILLLLFFPISYRVKGKKYGESPEAKVRIKWLFGFLRVIFDYPKNGILSVKILFFTVFKKDFMKKPNENETTTEESVSPTKDDNNESESIATDLSIKSEVKTAVKSADTTEKKKIKKSKSSFHIVKWLYKMWNSFCNKIDACKKRIKYIIKHIDFYKGLWEEQNTQLLLKYCLGKLSKVLKVLKPRKWKIQVTFGTGSPDTTGLGLAAIAVLFPTIIDKKDCFIHPDFENQIYEGEIDLRGHFCIFTILIQALSVLMDKRLHRLIARIKHFENRQNKKCV